MGFRSSKRYVMNHKGPVGNDGETGLRTTYWEALHGPPEACRGHA
ncbi:hypothetical protein [Caballeronia hypogeia]|nr:hypothetical protein [Caballeronia hypogeia]